ncbi:MAG: PKD domain-containing protein [Ilyomonas sp.]
MKAKSLVYFLLLLSTFHFCKAQQKGFIYVHLRSTSEDTSVNVSFKVSGGSTTVPAFTLNDRPYLVNNIYDIGASHGTTSNGGGDGELWAVTSTSASIDGRIYRRAANSATWEATSGFGTSVDGAGPNQYVYVNDDGYAYFYNAGSITNIYNPASYSGVKAVDIAYGNGIIVIVTSNGNILKNYRTSYPYYGSWSTIVSGVNARRIDVNPSNGNIVYLNGSGNIYTATSSGTSIVNLGAPASRNDVAFDDEGVVYSTGYYYSGGWKKDETMPNLVRVTGNPGHQVWGATSGGSGGYSPARTIFTRITSNGDWLDDERVRTTVNDNSIMIPVNAGTYTITESVPAGWSIAGALLYDPTNNSSADLPNKRVIINVAAGEVVNVVFQNGLLIPISMKKQCIYQLVEDFGTGPNAPVNVTSYHWQSNSRSDDGYYAIGKSSAGWPFSTLVDHTQGDGTGNFMIVNASFQADEFYRKRMTNLIRGVQYELSYWVASIGGGINPNILVAVSDSNGIVLASGSTGPFNHTYWKQYKFVFTATTGVSDIYIQNNANGGGGNDIALDDIAINPVSTVVPPINIEGDPLSLCSGSIYNLQNNLTGGLWTSSTTSVASINPRSGTLTTLKAGTTTVTYNITNAIGCNSSSSSLFTVKPSPVVSASAAITTVCRGQTVELTSTPGGGTAPYTFSWSGSAGINFDSTNSQITTATSSAGGTFTYSINILDSNGCGASASTVVTVTNNVAPTVTASVSKTQICEGTSVTLSSTISGGKAPINSVWEGSNITDEKKGTAFPTETGNYTITVTDKNNCIVKAYTPVVTVNPAPQVTMDASDGMLCYNQSLSLISSPTGGTLPYSYLWTGTSNSKITGSTTTQNTTAKPTQKGKYTYTIKVTDAKGCSATASQQINVTISNSRPPAVTITSPTSQSSICSNIKTGVDLKATASGALLYTYLWEGSGVTSATSQNTTAYPTETGAYTVSVKDVVSGCIGTATTPVITINPAPSVSISSTLPNLCITQFTVGLTSDVTGGTGDYSYFWSSTYGGGLGAANMQSTTATPPSNGTYTYTVKVTDSKGCSDTDSKTVAKSSNPLPVISNIKPGSSFLTCANSNISLGATVANGTAPYTYAWDGPGLSSPSSLTTTATPGVTGSYSYQLSVTDKNGCMVSANTATLTVNPALTLNAYAGSNIVCSGGSLNLFAVPGGGSGIYTSYLWTGSGLDQINVQNTSAVPTKTGSYSVSVTDSKGCVTSASTPGISLAAALSVTTSISKTQLCFNETLNLGSEVKGGSGAGTYTYSWTGSTGSGLTNPDIPTTTANPTVTSSYALLVIDKNGCTATSSTPTVTLNPAINITASADASFVCNAEAVNLSSVLSGGSGDFTSFAWTGSGINNVNTQNTSASPTASGSFSVTVKDDNNCAATATTNIVSVNPAINLTASAEKPFVCSAESLKLLSTVTGGTGILTYSWSGSGVGVTNTQNTTATPVENGNYSLLVKDAKGCTATASTSVVEVNAPLVVTATSNKTFVCYAQPVNLNSTANGGSGLIQKYLWTGSGVNVNNRQNITATSVQTGSYTVTITDSKGCTGTATTATVVTNPAIKVNATSDKTVVCINPPSTINLTTDVTGGSGSYVSYVWSGSGLNLAGKSTKTTTAIPTVGGVYTVNVTDDKGCTASGSTVPISVTVLEPQINLNCNTAQGYAQVTEVSGTPNISYLWSTTSGGTFSPNNTVPNPKIIYYGQYSIKVTDQNSCIGTSSVIFNSTSCTLLSVTLLNFNAEKKDEKGLIYWSTSTEINNDHFEIERSIDGVNWIKIGLIPGNQTTKVKHDYQFTDVKPLTGKNYYRLKQVDVDGKFTYSPVRYLEFNSAWNVTVFPNPVSGNYIRVNSNEPIVRVYVVDMTGRVLLSYIPTALPDGTFDLNVDKMTTGGYIIRVINQKGDVKNLKMIKGSR